MIGRRRKFGAIVDSEQRNNYKSFLLNKKLCSHDLFLGETVRKSETSWCVSSAVNSSVERLCGGDNNSVCNEQRELLGWWGGSLQVPPGRGGG